LDEIIEKDYVLIVIATMERGIRVVRRNYSTYDCKEEEEQELEPSQDP